MNAPGSVDMAVGSHPLIGRTLVVTRAASQADGLVDALEALGAGVVRLPATLRAREAVLEQDVDTWRRGAGGIAATNGAEAE